MSPDWTGERAARTEPAGLSKVAEADGWDDQPVSGPDAAPAPARPAARPTPTGPAPTPFDVLGPLPTGTTVLEASAGTGKTYTIAALAARYVAEGHVELDQLMMVTFGRMATDELRVRVRERLVRLEAQLSDALGRTPPGTPVPERDDVARPAAGRRRRASWPGGRSGWPGPSPTSTPPPSPPPTSSACGCWTTSACSATPSPTRCSWSTWPS